MNKGLHIVFEGPDAVGKSTQIQLTKEYIESLGRKVVLTREPGGTSVGLELRKILLETDLPIHPRAEALMMAADRAQDVHEIILPSIEFGIDVLSDRFIPSSLVYQGVVRELGVDTIYKLSEFALGGHIPDITLCFDLEDELAVSRMDKNPDRIEREGLDFHQKVRDAYRDLAIQFSWDRIDVNGSVEEVFERIKKIIDNKMAE